MSGSAPFEMITDDAGSVTFGWIDEGVYYARFARGLSSRLGAAFAARLGMAVESVSSLKYFSDARGLENFDLLARSALVRVVSRQRRKFAELTILPWAGGGPGPAMLSAIGEPLYVATDADDFERRLMAAAPRARGRLPKAPEPPRSRYGLRR